MRFGTARAGVALGLLATAAFACGRTDRASATSNAAQVNAASAAPPSELLAFRSDARGIFHARTKDHDVRANRTGAFSVSGTAAGELTVQNLDDASQTGAASVADDGTLATAHRGYTERIANVDDGVEQSFRFEHAPNATTASGDVEIALSTFGLSYIGQTPHGLHFGSRGHGMRYGNGEWIDADGRRTAVPARWVDGHIALRVPRDVVASAKYPAILDPLIGPEVAVDRPTAAIPWEQIRAAAGGSASQFYVAWIDTRRVGFSLGEGNVDVYGARVDPVTGVAVPADGSGVSVLQSLFYAPELGLLFPIQSPVVASDGTNFIVAADEGGSVVAARVDGATGLVAPTVSADGGTESSLAIATFSSELGGIIRMGATYAGGKYILAWSDSTAVSIARVDASTGVLDDPGGKQVAPNDATQQQFPVVSCAPAAAVSCVVTWLDQTDGSPHVARFDPASGATMTADAAGPVLALPAAGQQVVGMTYDDAASAYVMAYTAAPAASAPDIHAVLYNPTTGAVSGTGVVLTTDQTSEMHLTFDGARIVASWPTVVSGADTVSVQTFDPATLASTATKVVALTGGTEANGGASDLATIGQMSLVVDTSVVTQSSETVSQARGLRFDDGTGKVVTSDVGGVSLVGSSNAETWPALATNGTNELVVWEDSRVPNGALIATRLDRTGAPLDGVAGITLGAGVPGGAFRPAVASNGSDYVVVWLQNSSSSGEREIDGVRIDGTTGMITGTVPALPFGGVYANPAIAFDGTNYGVAIAVDQNVDFVRLDGTSLARVGGTTVLTPVTGDVRTLVNTAIAAGGGQFLIAWESDPALIGASSVVQAARITSSGAVVSDDGNGVQLSSETSVQEAPALAYASGSFFVSWQDTRDGQNLLGIYGRKLSLTGSIAPDGTTPDIAIGKAPLDEVGFVGGPAMTDAEDGLSVQTVWSWNDDLIGGLVSYGGVAREPVPLTFDRTAGDVEHMAMVSLGSGSMLVAYARLNASNEGGNFHVYTRVLQTGPTSGSCTNADDCASRYCSDGFCCDAPCTAACQTCATTPGKCTSVTSGSDPGTCSGAMACSAKGTCGDVNGTACDLAASCASGNCVDGVCCESACSGGCDVCNAVPGSCTVVAAGSSGESPACTPYVCDGTSHACASQCTSDQNCERPYGCAADGKCELLTGAICTDAQTLRSATGVTQSCAPYGCSGSMCLTLCDSVRQCASGSICDGSHHCVDPTAIDDSGCAVAPGSTSRRDEAAFAFLCSVIFGVSRRRRVRVIGKETEKVKRS